MKKKLLLSVAVVLVFGCSAFAGSWVGVVSDSHCGLKHSVASDAAAACVKQCVSMGAKYVLVRKGKIYKLTPQDKFEGFGGHRVKVSGMKMGDTITVEDVKALKAHKRRLKVL